LNLPFQNKPATNNNTIGVPKPVPTTSMPRPGDKPAAQSTNVKKTSHVNGSNAGIGVSVLDQLLPAAEANQKASNLVTKNAVADFDKLKQMKKNQDEFVSHCFDGLTRICF
jgi:hypothetical protein